MPRNDFSSDYLAHHGILGQKWGIRRYQNPDGSLTSAGRERYGVKEGGGINDISSVKGIKRRLNDVDKAIARNKAKRGKALTKVNSKMWKSQNAQNATKAEKHSEYIRKGEEETQRLLQKAASEGYDVKSKNTLRNVSSGAEIIGKSLLNSALATAMLLPFGRTAVIPSWSFVQGKKYSVTDPNEKTAKEKFAEANQRARERTSINAAVEKGLAEYNAAKKEARDYDKKTKWDEWDEQKSDDLHRKAAEKNPRISALEKKRNSFKDDADKDMWERGVTAKDTKARKEAIKDRVDYAKKTGMYDMEFLERNLDLDPVTEKQMKGEKLYKAYEKFLEEEYKKNH